MAGLLTGNHWGLRPAARPAERRRHDTDGPPELTAAPRNATIRGSAPDEQRAPYIASVIGDLEGLDALKQSWAALFDAAGNKTTPFQSFSFCRILAGHCLAADPFRRLHVVAVYQTDGTPVLILPMTVTRRAGIVIAEWLGEPVNQYGDIVASGTPDDAALDAAISTASAHGIPDLFDFRKVREDALIAPWLGQRGRPTGVTGDGPFVDLTLDEKDLPFQSGRRKKDRRRKLRRIEQRGNVEFDVAVAGDRINELTVRCLEMKLNWINEKGLVSRALSKKWVRDALVEFAGRSGNAVVSSLSVDGDFASLDVGFIDGHSYYAFLGVISYDYAEASPGDLLTERVIDWCLDNEIERFDWLPPLQRYKLSWATGTASVSNFGVTRSWHGKLYSRVFVGFAEPRLKTLFYKTPDPVRRLIISVIGWIRPNR